MKRVYMIVFIISCFLLSTVTLTHAAILYGVKNYQIDEIDTADGSVTILTSTGIPTSGNLNGIAYDATNDRIYFARRSPRELYFRDNTETVTKAGDLSGDATNACFYMGKYYYVPQGTDDLQEVTLNPDGSIASETKIADITDNAKTFIWGDISIRADGILFGSGRLTGTSTEFFFSYDLNTLSSYNEILIGDTSETWFSQIAFGSDGSLYGSPSGATGDNSSDQNLYTINTTDASRTQVDAIILSDYADIASGPGCPGTLTQGYWKTHEEDWPTAIPTTTTLCDLEYLDILNTPAKGNAWYILAYQYIAAVLNEANGEAVPVEVQDAMTDALSLLETYCNETPEIPKGTPDRDEAIDLGKFLEKYNKGLIAPGHCAPLE